MIKLAVSITEKFNFGIISRAAAIKLSYDQMSAIRKRNMDEGSFIDTKTAAELTVFDAGAISASRCVDCGYR